jgi:DNA/RNA endonuclease G (NUC1)
VSELHYDNTGTDAGEAIEISGPSGASLTGWSVVLYNGNGGAPYTTTPLSGTIPATCDDRGVVVLTYPSNGIQNGDPDGIALVNGTTVVEFLSYEGTFVAVGGAANGMTSTDIGVREAGTEALGMSLSRNGAGVWSGPAANTFGACNDDDEPPPVEVASVTVTPASASVIQGATTAFTATAFDAQNQPVQGVVFTWSSSNAAIATVNANGIATGVALGDVTITASAPNDVVGTAALTVTPVPALPNTRLSELHYDNTGTDLTGWSVVLYNGNGGGAYDSRAVSGTIPASCGARGVVLLRYPQDGVQNGSPDGVALVNALGEVVEFLSYEGSFAATNGPAAGRSSIDLGVSEPGTTPIGHSLQRSDAGVWQAPAASSFGGCNANGPIPVGNTMTFTGRTFSDVPLPVGFQDQIFANVRDPSGQPVTTGVTWTSETPAIASIDANGVFTAFSAGTAVFRAVTTDGLATTATYALPTRVAVASATAQYAGNAEFGEPADGDASDDFIVRHPQYTASYNSTRNTPNWVSYNLEATHFGPEDRCDCFTFDPSLPATFTRYTTADYTGAGAIAGYGIDRGHLARSFDRTSASLDNAFTFYFTNIIPQAADLNQGPWAIMENHLGDLARLQNKEVYIVAGVAGNKGTVKNEGKIVIPTHTWKVAVVMPRNQGLATVDDLSDLEVIAAIMPNEPGVRNVDWNTYRTTVDAVETLSGYDVLALLRDDIEIAVESNTKPPVAVVNGPFASIVGEPVAMSAEGSSDPDGQSLTYLWSFGDGATGNGLTVSHTYAQAGAFTVRLIVRDPLTLADTITTTATVITLAQATGEAIALVEALETAGKLSGGSAGSLATKLDAAKKLLENGNTRGAMGQLRALLNELDALARSGRVTDADVDALHELVERVIAVIAT